MHAKKERDVIKNYFEEGLALAIRDALKSLFAEPQLPDNPFYYLASALGAYLDQHELWKLPDAALVSLLDDDGGLEVADAASKLCKLSACSNVWGLPHVLRCVSKEGVKVLQDVLANSMPDSFFPGPMPFSSKNSYTTQILASVQGSSALWRPAWLEFPELVVRCDVVVRGPRLDEALGQLAALLLQDLAELDAVPLYFTNGLRVVEPLGAAAAAALAGSSRQRPAAPSSNPSGPAVGSAAAGAVLWGLADMLARPEEFRKVLSRSVLAGKCLELAAVVLVDAPTDAQHKERSLRFEVAIKRYCFHFWSTPESPAASAAAAALNPDASAKAKGKAKPSAGNSSTSYTSHKLQAEVSHYGSSPFEALFEGFFLDPAAAKQYLQLFLQDHEQPYAPAPLAANVDQLACLIDSHMLEGATLQGLQRLLLLVMLQDPLPRSPGPLAPASLLSLEDLLLARAQTSQVDMLLSTLPNLLRMANTGAAVIQGVAREIEAVQLVAEMWPARRQACRVAAAAAAAAVTDTATNDAASPTGAGAAGAPASSTLEWLDRFNMSAQVLQQLVSLQPRIAEATGSGIFSGISLITNQLLAELPAAVPADAAQCDTALAAAQDGLAALQQLLEAAALTLADALLDRCRDVTWALARFGIHLVDSVMARAALTADEGSAQPEWALHVAAVTEAQVRAGAVAERVAAEGVMLQYAVDTQLDLLLSAVHASITEPPMPLNPYPRLLHLLRAHAARLDLWKDDTATVCDQMLNQLVLLDPRGFMYAASPPAAGRGGRGRRRGRLAAASGPEDDSADATVFGSYAAVTLCDCRALQTLAASLGALLSERHWQQGAYSADVLLALVGDAWLSGALGLGEDAAAAAATQAAGALPGQAAHTRCLFEHPRFYAVEAEEHHQVSGPRLVQAAAVFAAGVADYVQQLHRHSPHIVVQLAVHLGSNPRAHSLQQLLSQQGRQCLVSGLVEAVQAAAAAHPVTFPDARLATLTLLVAVREGIYVRLLKHLHFNYRDDGLPLQTTSAAAALHRPGGAAQPAFLMPSSGDPGSGTPALQNAAGCGAPDAAADSSEPRWCLGVYQRVFLTESSAAAWQACNGLRGDPAQPFHHQHIVQQAARQVKQVEAAGGLLDAQKLMLCAGAAMQDVELLLHVSRAMQSAAQELRCLQAMSASLQFLLSPQIDDSSQRGKLDSERVRRLFLVYCGRLRAALASPRCCYFSGFAAAAPRLIGELKEQVLGGSLQLGGTAAGLMRQLNLWTRCCELSVAASIHDCFEPGVTRLRVPVAAD